MEFPVTTNSKVKLISVKPNIHVCAGYSANTFNYKSPNKIKISRFLYTTSKGVTIFWCVKLSKFEKRLYLQRTQSVKFYTHKIYIGIYSYSIITFFNNNGNIDKIMCHLQ